MVTVKKVLQNNKEEVMKKQEVSKRLVWVAMATGGFDFVGTMTEDGLTGFFSNNETEMKVYDECENPIYAKVSKDKVVINYETEDFGKLTENIKKYFSESYDIKIPESVDYSFVLTLK